MRRLPGMARISQPDRGAVRFLASRQRLPADLSYGKRSQGFRNWLSTELLRERHQQFPRIWQASPDAGLPRLTHRYIVKVRLSAVSRPAPDRQKHAIDR